MKKIPHKWRKFSKEKRLNIPLEYFNIPEKEIKRIRKISNTKKKLIESARLQYESFGNIHADLTAWLAGYASDIIVRSRFGSTQKLRNFFIKPNQIDKRFNPTWQDKRRNIKLPSEMSEYLAEECGIHVGDGNLYKGHNSKNVGSLSHRYSINGDLRDEYTYHTEYIAKLMEQIYNCKGYFAKRTNKNSIESVYKSRVIIEYKRDILKFPIGPKTNILIPKTICGNKEFEKRCLCGIFDTDFTLDNMMILKGRMASKKLLKQICKILSKHKINYGYKDYNNYGYIRIIKDSSLKILDEWKLNNEKHTSKYSIWKEVKKYFPFTSTPERLAFLDNKLNLDDLEKITETRRKELHKKIKAPRAGYPLIH